jgi:HSP20 family protein
VQYNRPEAWTVSPFAQVPGLEDVINRVFGSPLGDLSRAGEFFTGSAPALDLHEDKDNLVATVELPGMKKEDIEVSVQDGVLNVSGERTSDQKRREAGSHRTERFFGRFQRALSLPKPVKPEAIKAVYRDGVLTVTMPKTEEAKPKQIAVSLG